MTSKPLTQKQLARLFRKSPKNPHRSMESVREDLIRASKRTKEDWDKVLNEARQNNILHGAYKITPSKRRKK